MKSVGVVGAGVAGLTVAHELVERGFAVTVYESAPTAGGKAGSQRTADGWVREHVNKNFSAHYYCLPETLKRIPCEGGGTVMDRLVPAARAVCRFPDGSEVALSGRLGMTRQERGTEVRRFVRALAAQGLPVTDTLDFLRKHARLIWMSEARRRRELDGVSYADYLGASKKGPAFRHLLQLIEISAAANLEGPARAAAEQTLRVFGRMFNPHRSASMINALDGPSHERFIAPWVAHLESLGVTFRFDHPVERLARDESRHGVVRAGDDGPERWHDFLVVATPTPVLRRLLPRLGLPESVDKWAHGFYFALRDRPRGFEEGDLRICLGSAWSVIAGARRFEGRWYLWTCASNASTPGAVHGLRYPDCTPEQLREELVAQCGFDQPELVEGFFPGKGLDREGDRWRNAAPLYAATLGAPEVDNATDVPGVYVAGESTRTTVTVATMEKANESGKRCAAAICDAAGLTYPAEKYTYDPFPAPRLRRIDRWLDERFGRDGAPARAG